MPSSGSASNSSVVLGLAIGVVVIRPPKGKWWSEIPISYHSPVRRAAPMEKVVEEPANRDKIRRLRDPGFS
jgi:hypothetical protein